MKLFGWEIGRAETRSASIENPQVKADAEGIIRYFGGGDALDIGPVSVEQAMQVPAVFAAVNFLTRTLAALPLHAWRKVGDQPERIKGGIETLVHEAPNTEWTSFGLRQYFWNQVFTRGRGLLWIERGLNGQPVALRPINVTRTAVEMVGTGRVYSLDGRRYASSEVIDLPFALKDDQVGVVGPIARCAGAIRLALNMQVYGSKFFAGGGVPPLALTGPLPTGAEAQRRAMADVQRAIDTARETDKPVFPIPPGYDLKPVAVDPDKGQMTEARRFQLEEIARVFQLPPVFLQDLSKGTFSNTEQQDLFFVKHLIGQWAEALEQEMNLKLFGQMNGRRYVEHNLDGLQRGDFKSRIEGLARAINTAQLTPDEARELEGRPSKPHGDKLYLQGATVPLGSQPLKPATGEPNDDGDRNPDAEPQS
ncbi:phage portal protein [Sphingomonas fennica]|uniref:Phage portal protein n=1 Tax=Edaphosphingomonas fennica TaxID=114404 RepID=A0A2T4HVX9_9SPHN|nr:phage portal protein [Sphingomonas fennica]PTD19910.1 phage portal protein [Sphingomonas fennica]